MEKILEHPITVWRAWTHADGSKTVDTLKGKATKKWSMNDHVSYYVEWEPLADGTPNPSGWSLPPDMSHTAPD